MSLPVGQALCEVSDLFAVFLCSQLSGPVCRLPRYRSATQRTRTWSQSSSCPAQVQVHISVGQKLAAAVISPLRLGSRGGCWEAKRLTFGLKRLYLCWNVSRQFGPDPDRRAKPNRGRARAAGRRDPAAADRVCHPGLGWNPQPGPVSAEVFWGKPLLLLRWEPHAKLRSKISDFKSAVLIGTKTYVAENDWIYLPDL